MTYSEYSVATGDKPLLTLEGHISTITDLSYSNNGRRILTASQKDAEVRIWSWTRDPSLFAQKPVLQRVSHSPSSILIKLTRPQMEGNANRRRQRNNRGQEHLISCDVACWIKDDTKIMTSQCEYARQNANEIIPGSQYIFLWDASNGNCLLGIASAHTKQCAVVIPHPFLTDIFCSAGADGFAKVWSWESGECIFEHKNVAATGPVDPNDRGKSVGYLDGHFSPDGSALVLSDDTGRVSYFDSSPPPQSTGPPGWMKEQYFSNDYYDLFYDENGYCVERGSELPPHLAPKGSRCTHSGVAFSSHLHDRFRKLNGPIPISVDASRFLRQAQREKSASVLSTSFPRIPSMVGRFHGSTTKVFNDTKSSSSVIADSSSNHSSIGSSPTREPRSVRQLSSNWRWRDYDDIERELGNDDGVEPDSDDEEFDPTSDLRATARVAEDSDSDENLAATELLDAEDARSRPAPLSERVQSEDEDSAGEFVEFMSTNNTPSGPFVADYDHHVFKLTSRSQANNLHREWVTRNESTSCYEGRKIYTPQVGDVVVYVPRVHFESIKDLPVLEAPFMKWPEDTSWPVVKCTIRNVRYRFPFIQYRRQCK